jgi:hypothetical protein
MGTNYAQVYDYASKQLFMGLSSLNILSRESVYFVEYNRT